MNLKHLLQSLLQLLIQQYERSERIAQIAVTSGDDLIDRHLVLIKSTTPWRCGRCNSKGRQPPRSCDSTATTIEITIGQ